MKGFQKLTKEEMGEIKGGYYSCPRSKGEFTRTYNALNKTQKKEYIIDYTDATKDNFIIAAVPMLYHIENGNIENFYFGDAQILQFLVSNKLPLDEYINL